MNPQETVDASPAGPRDWRTGDADDQHIKDSVVASTLAAWRAAWS